MENAPLYSAYFVFLCLLTNSIYARTTEYENPKDTILDMMLYFDLNARQADKDYQGNGKTLDGIDSLLAHPAHSIHLYSIILVSPDYITEKEPDIAPGQKRSEEVKVFLCRKYPQVNRRPNLYPYRRRIRDAFTETDNGRQTGPRREDVLALIDYHHDNPVKCKISCNIWMPAYLINIFQPAATGTQTDKIRVCLSYPEEKEGKTPPRNRRPMIEETEFIPIDRGNDHYANGGASTPQKERRQVITETEKQ